MRSFHFLKLLLSVIFLTSFQSDTYPKLFTSLLQRAHMKLEKPEGYTETAPIENRQMNYEYALKHPTKRFEVRYAIRPLDSMIIDYKAHMKTKKEGDIFINPNKFYESSLQATLLNISGGELPEITVFGSKAVKDEFNADWGATAFVNVGEEFGQDYKFCMVVALHKDDLGDAYYFYLADDRQVIIDTMMDAFHSLKFQ